MLDTDEPTVFDDGSRLSAGSSTARKTRGDHVRRSGHSQWRWRLKTPILTNLTVLLGYILVSLWLWKQVVPHIATRLLGGGLSDPGLILWWLRWAPFSILHGHNPFYPSYINAPTGASAMWNISMLAVGTMFLPITQLLGVVVTFNLVCILGPALSAWTCSIWLRRHVRLIPSIVGGLLFGFSPFVVEQGIGHLQLIWLCLLPIIAMLIEDIIWKSPRPWWPWGPLLGVVVAAQLLVSSEVLLMTVIGMGLAIVVLAVMYPGAVRDRLKPAALGLLSGGLVACLLVGWPVLRQFSAATAIRGPIPPIDAYEAEPADLVNAPYSVVLHTPHSLTVAARLVAFENGLYVGVPLIVVTLLTCVLARRHRKIVWMAAIVAAVFFIFSLGGRARNVPGAGHHGPLLPWGYIERAFPLTQNILAVRFAVIIWLALSLIAAIALDEALGWVGKHSWRGVPVGLLAAACLAPLVPVPENLTTPVAPTPAFFTSSEVRHIPRGSVALVAPIPDPADDSGMLWQVQSGMWFKEIGGYVLFPAGAAHRASYWAGYPVLDELLSVHSKNVFDGPVTPYLRWQALGELRLAHARTVIVGESQFHGRLAIDYGPHHGEHYSQLVRTVEQLLGRSPDRLEGGVALWYLQTA